MRRETQNTVLLLVGMAMLMITSTGAYSRYVKPSMSPWLITAGAVIIALALSVIVADIRSQGRSEVHDDGHGHDHRSGIVWLLVIPILVLTFVVPPALDARAVAPTVTAVSNDVLKRPFPPLPAEPAPTVSLPEVLMRIATDSSNTLNGRLITVTGFTMKDGDSTDLAKIVIICCAADAQLARLRLAGAAAASAANMPENTWLSVQGSVPPGQRFTGTDSVPTLDVSRTTPIDPPATPYG
ncbi:MAG: hypothetical protein QOH60_2710 [Mycobacterium sp.]|nr:hypothetical protein [Mycobacterium sp.]